MTPNERQGVNLTDSAQVGHNAIGPTTGDIIINSGGNREICSMCKTPIDAVNNPGLFCFKEGCNTLFCNNCESFFRESRQPGERPYCAEHISEATGGDDVPPPPSVGAIVGAVLRDTDHTPQSSQPPQSQLMGSIIQQRPMHTGAQVFVDPQNPMAGIQMQGNSSYNPYVNQKMINPVQAFINTISNWSGKGRAQRSEFWFGTLGFNILFFMIFSIGFVLDEVGMLDEDIFFALFCGLFIFFIPLLSLMIRRIQDTGNSGWWVLLIIVPYIGSFVMFIFAVLPSQPHPNKYDLN